MKVLVSLVSLIAFLMVVLPGPLYKFGVVELGTAFAGFRIGVYVGGAALVLLLVQVIFMRKTATVSSTIVAVVFAGIAIFMPLNMMDKAKSVPPIHDISTDVVNPPICSYCTTACRCAKPSGLCRSRNGCATA